MIDLEDRIRGEVTRRSEAYVPADDLPQRISARVRHRRNVRRARRATAAAALVLVVVAAGTLGMPGTDDDSVKIDGGPVTSRQQATSTSSTTHRPTTTSASTTTSQPKPTTTVPEAPAASETAGASGAPSSVPPASASTATTAAPASPPAAPVPASQGTIGSGTPIHRSGVGAIEVGMTVRQAIAASGNSITADSLSLGSTCVIMNVDGTAFALVTDAAGVANPYDGRIVLVQGAASTVEGVRIGDPVDALHAAYGTPTQAYTRGSSTYEVFQQGEVAYGVGVAGGTVSGLSSGYPSDGLTLCP
jgi:hypothetical protein